MGKSVDIEALIASLTLEEKITLLAGQSFWDTAAIPEKGIPSIKTSDGPNGTRGVDFLGNTRAACFPAASCVAASFDREIARSLGKALAEEGRSKGASCLLAPTVCIHRHPLGGRNFESYSEDPFLTGKLASQMIQGAQSLGLAATIKHFVANEQETERLTVDETISERALREIYLRPFEIAIKEANPWAVMTAYNKINGVHCDSNPWLLGQVLRGEWGWKGVVISDWGGTNSVAEGIKAGMEVEMPGPPRVRKVEVVLEAVKNGELTEEDINERLRNLFEFLDKLKAFDTDHKVEVETAVDRPEHRVLIRHAGARGMVLLKNENNVLPLTKEKVKGKKIALIGLAKDALTNGGGSAGVNAHYKITPWDGLQAALGDSVEFTYAKGVHRERLLRPIPIDGSQGKIVGLDGQPGFSYLLYDLDNTSEPTSTRHSYPNSTYNPLGSQETMWKILEIVGDFTPKETGNHYIAASGFGTTQIFVDDQTIFEQKGNTNDPMGALFQSMNEDEFTHRFEAGKTYRLRIRSHPPTNIGSKIIEGRTGVRMGFMLESEHDADLEGEAVRAAKEADLAIVFTGHDPQWETEGRDQDSFHLPSKGSQDRLVAAVAGANPQTIVVNSTGVAVAMPWLDQISGLVQSWFSGQECGNAIADVLTGAVTPEGHLPVSLPKHIEDAPAHGNFPGEYVNGKLKVNYAEGVFVGYRHYDRIAREKVNFPFGFGLSYTTFQLGNLKVAPSSEGFIMSAEVTNTGKVAGGIAVQIYVGKAENSAEHPVKSLVAFQKVRLQPGEKQNILLDVAGRDLAYFDEGRHEWVVDAGKYEFHLASSAVDIADTAAVVVGKEVTYKA
ncbi:uncharacterized protein E0L32_007973 [Thyridium curvatum]|uniref:beta-glucosidase n=1 Tax=Thyridium curvatum TaxID=1093900 RepID=A0A507AMM5_9PEZI|nr:uncharacterized protein E0L32_007973 [Thyridium curvatum]TPX11112.1 hypothetical protein E0L32_007973 [Thyridium curvatum]